MWITRWFLLEQRQLSERRNYWKVLFTLQFPWDSVETSVTTFVIYRCSRWNVDGCTLWIALPYQAQLSIIKRSFSIANKKRILTVRFILSWIKRERIREEKVKRSEQLLKETFKSQSGWKEISVCDLFRNNRLLVEMREGGEKKRLLRHTKLAEPVQCVYVPMSDRKSVSYIVPRKRMQASPCLCIPSPVHYHYARNRKAFASTLSTWRVISTPGKKVRQRSICRRAGNC